MKSLISVFNSQSSCSSDCFGVLDCEWCTVDSDGKTHLDKPYCALQKECFGGIVGAKSPYADGLGLMGESTPGNQLVKWYIMVWRTGASSCWLVGCCPFNVLLSMLCPLSRWGGSVFKHDQERPRGASGRGHHGVHHGAGAGGLRLQTPNSQKISPAHVAAGSTGWVWC